MSIANRFLPRVAAAAVAAGGLTVGSLALATSAGAASHAAGYRSGIPSGTTVGVGGGPRGIAV